MTARDVGEWAVAVPDAKIFNFVAEEVQNSDSKDPIQANRATSGQETT